MKYTKEKIVRDMALRLEAAVAGAADVVLPVEQSVTEASIIRAVEEAAEGVMLSAPFSDVYDDAARMASVVRSLGDGLGVIPLPRDFLRLVALRLKGWKRDVTEVLDLRDTRVQLLFYGLPGVRADAWRPAVAFRASDTGGELLVAGLAEEERETGEGRESELALYLKRPGFDAYGIIEIPQRLYQKVLDETERTLNF